MSKFIAAAKKFAKAEEGATLVEYGLLVALIAVVFDVRTRRIPNALTFGAAACALLYAAARTMDAALTFLRDASAAAPGVDSVRVYDPVPMAIQRLGGVERAQLLVESDRRGPLQAFLRAWLDDLRTRRSPVRWQIEVDPQEI